MIVDFLKRAFIPRDKTEPWRPVGVGAFVQSLARIELDEIASMVEAGDIRWVAIQAVWQYEDKPTASFNWPCTIVIGNDQRLKRGYGGDGAREKIAEFQRLGVTVIPFGYPVPGKGRGPEMAEALSIFADLWQSPAVLLDPEKEWRARTGEPETPPDGVHQWDKRHAWQAARLVRGVRKWTGRSVGVTSFGAPWNYPRFPLRAFSGADWSIPQTYDGNNKMGPDYPRKSHAAYRAAGHKHIVGAVGTYRKTARQVLRLARRVMEQGVDAICSWKWGATSINEARAIRAAYDEAQVRKVA